MNNNENITIVLLTITAVILTAAVFVQTDESAFAASSPDRSGNYIAIPGQISSVSDFVYIINGQTDTLLAYFADERGNKIGIVGEIDLGKEFRRLPQGD